MNTPAEMVPPVSNPAALEGLALEQIAEIPAQRGASDVDILSVAIWLKRGAPDGSLDEIREEVALQLCHTIAAWPQAGEGATLAEARRSTDRIPRMGPRRGRLAAGGSGRQGRQAPRGLHDDAAD